MAFSNVYRMNVDTKRRLTSVVPTFKQGDNGELRFKIYDEGRLFDLSDYTHSEITFKLPNGDSLVGNPELIDGELVYYFNRVEMSVVGKVETVLSIMSGDSMVSLQPFTCFIFDSMKTENLSYVGILQDLIKETQDQGLSIEGVLHQVGDTLGLVGTELNDLHGFVSLVEGTELTRTTNENIRRSNEQIRLDSEYQRISTENTRISDELTRVNAESTRIQNESTRQSNEIQRQNRFTAKINEFEGKINVLEEVKALPYHYLTTYHPPNFVTYNGSTYVVLQPVTGVTPTDDGINYRLAAQRGVDGTGSVSTINGIAPNESGDVELSFVSQEFIDHERNETNQMHIAAVTSIPTNLANAGIIMKVDGAFPTAPEMPTLDQFEEDVREILDDYSDNIQSFQMELSQQLAQKADGTQTYQQITNLNNAKADRDEVNTLAIEKADKIEVARKTDKTYVDTLVGNALDGSPRDIFYSINALRNTYPSGQVGIYLVYDTTFTDGARAFIWDSINEIWADLGTYQGIVLQPKEVTSGTIADNTIPPRKMTFLDEIFINVFNYATITQDKILEWNGNLATTPEFVVSDYIPVDASTFYVWGTAARPDADINIAFYTANKTFISAHSTQKGNQSIYRTTPSNAAWVRFSFKNTVFSKTDFMFGVAEILPTTYLPFNNQIMQFSEDVELQGKFVKVNNLDILTNEVRNLFNKDSVTWGVALDSNGNVVNSYDGGNTLLTTHVLSDYIPFKASRKYVYGGNTNRTYYNNSLTKIRTVVGNNSGDTDIAPNVDGFVRFSFGTPNNPLETMMLCENEIPLEYIPYNAPLVRTQKVTLQDAQIKNGGIYARDYGIKGDGTDESLKIRNFLLYGAKKGLDCHFEPKTYKLNSSVLRWDAGAHNVIGHNTVFDFTENTNVNTAAVTVHNTNFNSWSIFIHKFEGIRLMGSTDANTTLDGFLFSDAEDVANPMLQNVHITGFRDHFKYENSIWCTKFIGVGSRGAKRYGLNFDVGYNAGENFSFFGCNFYMSKTAIYSPKMVGAYFFGCSFDYNVESILEATNGTFAFDGCHFEDRASKPMMILGDNNSTNDVYVNITGGDILGVTTSARTELIKTKGNKVHLTVNNPRIRLADTTLKSFHKAVNGTPHYKHFGGELVDNTTSQMISNSLNALYNGDFTNALNGWTNNDFATSTNRLRISTSGSIKQDVRVESKRAILQLDYNLVSIANGTISIVLQCKKSSQTFTLYTINNANLNAQSITAKLTLPNFVSDAEFKVVATGFVGECYVSNLNLTFI